jgi:hypothetical protein
MPDSRAALLRAALGFLSLEPRAPELRMLHRWLHSCPNTRSSAHGKVQPQPAGQKRRRNQLGKRLYFRHGERHVPRGQSKK